MCSFSVAVAESHETPHHRRHSQGCVKVRRSFGCAAGCPAAPARQHATPFRSRRTFSFIFHVTCFFFTSLSGLSSSIVPPLRPILVSVGDRTAITYDVHDSFLLIFFWVNVLGNPRRYLKDKGFLFIIEFFD